MSMRKRMFLLVYLGIVSFATAAVQGPAVQPPLGRLAMLFDGNSPDPDDIGAIAVSLALLRAAGLQERLVYCSHSCDLVKNQKNISLAEERARHAMLQTSCDGTAKRWGGFDHLVFWDCIDQKTEALDHLCKAINASTSEDPLWIIEAGEPDLIYFALEKATPAKRSFVYILTHHKANDDSGDFVSWEELLSDFPVKEVRIPDQNNHLQVPIAQWDWAKNHADERIRWLWEQGKVAEQDDVVKFQKGKFDCSDAGMVLYWITGATDGGLKSGTVNDCKSILLRYIEMAGAAD